MKSRVGLAISIGCNFGLLGVLAMLLLRPPHAQQTASEGVASGETNPLAADTNSPVQIHYRTRPEFRFPTNFAAGLTWRSIESSDYRRYILNLRAIQCPERTIRDIIVADINEVYAARWKDLLVSQARDFRYWQTGQGLPGFPDAALDQQGAELDRERRDLIRELLDYEVQDSIAEFSAIDPGELALLFLPEDRRALVLAAQREFADAQGELFSGQTPPDELEAALQALRESHEQRLAALMTPEERLRYEMTGSVLAMNLRLELDGFEPTEEEFRQIYESRKRQEMEVEVAQVVLNAQIVAREAEEAEARALQQEVVAVQSQLLEQLGPERYAQLQRTSDPAYQTLMRVSRVNEVSRITANRVYEVQQIAQVEADRVRANTALSLEQQEVALNGIRAETERTINQNYGDAALRVFRSWNQQQDLLMDAAAAGR